MPSNLIGFITVSWGIATTLTGVVQNFAGLIVCRLFLGVVKGRLFPEIAGHLTFLYTKRELVLQIGYLFVSAALAGVCSGLLAFSIRHAQGTAYFLSEDKRRVAAWRLMRETGYTSKAAGFRWKVTCFPTIIHGINPVGSTAIAQVLTIPCYALRATTCLIAARFSDYQQKRGLWPITLGMVCLVCVVTWVYFARVEKRRAQGLEDDKIEGRSDEELAELEDDILRSFILFERASFVML
ncbi:hypothetical protein P154DRAFT_541689 [Amniculicola lignicola CBS 123094]|uniref:Uncharacterized protein n=1 Tax=Amniculicola lignicola CBS 123094 TaxID=1392246 RepID=A0A6A5WYP1_9PLEO|nr:hypothetical protein P154DRAFT_541689 [Amniculicola lignicola CBS 123094]